jgi:hypothetical protein
MTTADVSEPNLARPWAPHRAKIYLCTGLLAATVFTLMAVGVATGLIESTFTTGVVANLLFGIPVLLLPLVILWNAPRQQRSRLDKAAELTMFYLSTPSICRSTTSSAGPVPGCPRLVSTERSPLAEPSPPRRHVQPLG